MAREMSLSCCWPSVGHCKEDFVFFAPLPPFLKFESRLPVLVTLVTLSWLPWLVTS